MERIAEFDSAAFLDSSFKGLPLGSEVRLRDLGRQGWNVLRGEVGSPVAVLREAVLDANIETMREFCARAGVLLAPHAKTALSPQVVRRQLVAGAWGMTAAVPFQVQLLWSFGVDRVLLANELTDDAGLLWAARELRDHPQRELLCYVDSLPGVHRAERAFAVAGGVRPLGVLIELGHQQGRTGVRSAADGLALAEAIGSSPHLALVGVAGYEGTIVGDDQAEVHRRVDAYLHDVVQLAVDLRALGLFDHQQEVVVTAGGSLYFDRVARILGPLSATGVRVVLRSGCYVTHDTGLYERLGPSSSPGWDLPPFRAALEVWTRVVSRPEPGLVLLNAGRRDLSFDSGLPRPLRALAADGRSVDLTAATVTALADQHAFVSVPPDCRLAVGDLVGLGVSHPCTTLDRWRLLLLVDEAYEVVGGVRTYF